ncbi:MAG: YncE family protein [Desulfuromonadaceae bacterium]|nr:YncE family protein [Desulfuromonadaceae bacterium]
MRTPLLLISLILLFSSPVLAAEMLFVSAFYDNVVNIFDAAPPHSAQPAVEVGVFPNQITVSPAGDKIYVANYTTGNINMIDPATLTVTGSITLSCNPLSLDISSDGASAYAVCRNTGMVSHIDLAEGIETGQTPVTFPYDLALDPQGRFAYVTRYFFSRYIYVVDLQLKSVVKTITVGRSPKGVVTDPLGRFIYVANSGSASVSVIDTATWSVSGSIPVATRPNNLTIDNQGSMLYVSHNQSNLVSVVDLNVRETVATIPVGIAPERLSLSTDGTRLYVANFGSNTLSVIDTARREVIGTVPTGNGPFDVALLEQRDTTPPQVSITPDTTLLWPPNHKLRDVNLHVVVTDNLDLNPQVQLVSIVSSEPCSSSARQKSAHAAPQSCDDVVGAEYGTFDTSFQLRAERFAFNGDDRVYTVTYKATDAAGNATVASVDIVVPLHN